MGDWVGPMFPPPCLGTELSYSKFWICLMGLNTKFTLWQHCSLLNIVNPLDVDYVSLWPQNTGLFVTDLLPGIRGKFITFIYPNHIFVYPNEFFFYPNDIFFILMIYIYPNDICFNQLFEGVILHVDNTPSTEANLGPIKNIFWFVISN